MKKTLSALALGASLLTSAVAFAKDTQATYDVSGWHCAGCTGKTEASLKKVKGVKTVTTDLDKNKVVVAYDDSKTNAAAIEKAIKDSGFEPKAAKN
jgi:Cu+-exporting ATPase